jgi:hypothetical protein
MITDFKKVLEELGYRLKDHGSYWRTNALYRSGDNTSALQIYKDSGVWKDFVEDSEFLPFQVLLEKTLNTKDSSVIKPYLNNHTLNTLGRPAQKQLLKQEKTYSDKALTSLLPHYDFYLDRGISEKTLIDFRCGLAMAKKMYQRIVFPISRQDGKIHGFSGRKVVDQDDKKPKWLHSGRCSDWFYPYYSIKSVRDEIEKKRCVHIVESIGDCLSLYEHGVKNVLVSFGLNISPKFIAKIGGLPIDKIFISFNNDFNSQKNRGFEGAIKSIFKICDSVDFKSIYFAPPASNDFGEMSGDDIESHVFRCKNLDHRESCVNILEIAEEMEDRGVNKSFSLSLKKYKKKYDFNYGDI